MSKDKNSKAIARNEEIALSRFLGRQVTKEKAAAVFIAAGLLSLAPILLGLRLYAQIPEIVETGLTDAAGNDDSLPRWALIYAIPALFFVLTAICHGQLYINQQRRRLPPKQVRMVGRWTIPILGFFFGMWAISSAAGAAISSGTLLLCALSVLLTLIGAGMFDCEKDAALGLRFRFVGRNDKVWRGTHRIVGGVLMAVGLILCVSSMLNGVPSLAAALTAVIALVAVVPLCRVIYR